MRTKTYSISIRIIVILITFSLTLTGCITKSKKVEEPKKEVKVLADLDGDRITESDLNEAINEIPSFYRARYQTVAGKTKILKSMGLRKIFLKEAKAMGIDQEPEIKETILKRQAPIISRLYLEEKLYANTNVPEKVAKKYYEDNSNEFRILPRIDIMYMQAENDTTAQVIKKALADSVDFYQIMNKYSINDYSKNHQGKISIKNSRNYIPGVGVDSLLFKKVWESSKGQFVGPIETKTGIHFFKPILKIEAGQEPYEDVKSKINYKLLSQQKAKDFFSFLENTHKELNIQIDSLVYKIDFMKPKSLLNVQDSILVTSDIEELNYDVGDIYGKFRKEDKESQPSINNNKADWLRELGLKDDIILYLAKKENFIKTIQDKPEMKKVAEDVILRETSKRLLDDKVQIDEDDIKKEYENNIDKYTQKKNRSIRVFVFDSKEKAGKILPEIKKVINNNDLDRLEEIIATETVFTHRKGIISKIKENGIIPGFGTDEIFSKKVWNTKVGEFSDIFENNKGNFVSFKVLAENKEIVKPYNLIKKQLIAQKKRKLFQEQFKLVKENLTEKYNLKYYFERLKLHLPADKLFEYANRAQTNRNYLQAIDYYNQIISDFSNGEDDYKAMFMKGFIYSENLQDNEKALEIFEKLLTKYDKGDLHQDAKFMIQFLKDGKEIELND